MRKSISTFAFALSAIAIAAACTDAQARGGRGGGRGGADAGAVIVGGMPNAGTIGGVHAGQHAGHQHGGQTGGRPPFGHPGPVGTPNVPTTHDRPHHHRHAHVVYRAPRSPCVYHGAHVYPATDGYFVMQRPHCGETYPFNGAMGPSPTLFR
ncbi:MAG: hypothetical protein ACRCYS_09785 [Beijerinckiaceae bacterium]